MRATRIAAVALPVLCAAVPLGQESPPLPPPPVAHAVDIWLGHGNGAGIDPALARAAERERLFPTTPPLITQAPAGGALGAGFLMVGSVAVLPGDDLTVSKANNNDARRGIEYRNLQEISRRFIAAFGDDYDQIAVFLGFTDYMSALSLAYQMRVKNDVRGIILTERDGQFFQDLFDASAGFGSPSGRLQTVLNMKRILAYGRGAADDPANNLYAVWAQEAAHRWAAYLHVRKPGDRALLGRQLAHWTKALQADASIMDGYLWQDHGDGTFTAVERDKRYGALDQYAMGLLPAEEVPPFFLLEEIRRMDDVPLGMFAPSIGARYKAKKVALTIDDVIAAMGPREPATDPSAADLRMGVVLLTLPGVSAEQVVGEAYRIDRTRRLWDDFYNEAGGERGKVCTQLLRPCRGPSLSYGAAALAETGAKPDAIVAPGETFRLSVPVTNDGNVRVPLQVKADGRGAFTFTRDTATVTLAPGDSGTLSFEGRVPLGTPCATLLNVDLATVEKPGRTNPSRGSVTVVVGARNGPGDAFEEGPADGWTVDPDGTDTATTGRWEQGTPERSDGFEFLMQPGAAWSGTGTFVTGAAAGANHSANDVSGGLTTLESPAYATDGLSKPRLDYQVYFVAADFQNEVLVPGSGDSLRVLASADGGEWTEIDRLTGMALGWQRRLIAIPPALQAPSLRFRFVVEDTDVPTVVEAVIDDVRLMGEAPSCSLPAPDGGTTDPRMPPGGCDCRVASSRGGTPLAAMVVVGAMILVGRRRRRR